jgi:hypothetical protein
MSDTIQPTITVTSTLIEHRGESALVSLVGYRGQSWQVNAGSDPYRGDPDVPTRYFDDVHLAEQFAVRALDALADRKQARTIAADIFKQRIAEAEALGGTSTAPSIPSPEV